MNEATGSLRACAALLGLLATTTVSAEWSLRELVDSLDLNKYALTGEVYVGQSLYSGVDNAVVVYPLLRNFGSSVDSDAILFGRGSYGGVRYVWDNDWTAGLVGKVQTLGFGSEDSEIFAGMERRNWSLQAGVTVGKRFDRLTFDLFATSDMLGEHEGEEYELLVAWPFSFGDWELVPQAGFRYQTADFISHYFGVAEDEALPGRPAYAPGGATTNSARLDWTWRFHPKWFVRVATQISFLPDEIRDSPLVDRDTAWSFSLGVSYDAPVFVAPDDPSVRRAGTALELSTGGFWVTSRSRVDLGAAQLPETSRLEDLQQLARHELVVPVEAAWQWGRLHRLDLRLFSLSRSASVHFDDAREIGDTTFGPDETVTTSFDTRVFRLAYGFAVLRDEQKELLVLGGLHVTDTDYRVRDADDSLVASTTPILPVIGLRGRVNMTQKWSVEAGVEAFVLDFADYSGELFDLALAARYRISDRYFLGLGYRYYRQDLRSGDESLFGDVLIDYRGPYAYLGLRF
jgi:outer membrane protein